MENINQNQKTENVQDQPSIKVLSGFTKYVSKKQLIIIGSLFALIIILLAVSLIMKSLGKKGFTDKSNNTNYSDNSQGKMQNETSTPEKTVKEYLTLLSQGNNEKANLLISKKADIASFDSISVLSNFTFEIQRATTEAPGTISYVNVEIIGEGRSASHYFTLLKEKGSGTWLLVKHESLSTTTSDTQEPSM